MATLYIGLNGDIDGHPAYCAFLLTVRLPRNGAGDGSCTASLTLYAGTIDDNNCRVGIAGINDGMSGGTRLYLEDGSTVYCNLNAS